VERGLPQRAHKHIRRALGINQDWYLAPDICGEAAFLTKLREQEVVPVVISDMFSDSYPGSTRLAILFPDHDARVVRSMLTHWPVGERVLAYSITGAGEFSLADTPLLPPAVARRVLSEAREFDVAMRPTEEHRTLLYIFSLVYLDGYQSGLPSENKQTATSVPTIKGLSRRMRAAGFEFPGRLTLEALDALANSKGFRPPLEMLERLAVRNSWIKDSLVQLGEWRGSEPAGWVVFYVRSRVAEAGKVGIVLDALSQQGFILLQTPQPTNEQMIRLAAEVRGGNWGGGPLQLSGGPPVMVVVGFDPNPLSVDRHTLQRHPLLDNKRVFIAKKRIRDLLSKNISVSQQYNGIHSTDNSVQAWRAIRSMYPQIESNLREMAKRSSATLSN
jgi:hypothetical protein